LSFFAFFSALSFFAAALFSGLARCAAFSSCAAFGISSLRSLIPWAPLEVQALSPSCCAAWGLFVLKKTF
jgi:hypothetical protein